MRFFSRIGLCLTLSIFCISCFAQTETESAPAPTVKIAPAETKEVVAEGRAAIGVGGALAARQAATQQALRNAVEKALGVYVSARTLTQNYQMVRDQVLTRSDGYAALKEILSEKIGTQEVSVTIRALVSLKPLAQQLKTLRLTRAWRICVAAKSDAEISAGAVAAVEQNLANAGFVVVSSPKEADISVLLSPRFEKVADIPAISGSYSATMHSVRGEVTARATRAGTGEIIAALSASDTTFHVSADAARSTAAHDAATALAPRLADALLVLPAAAAQPVTLVVSGLKNATQAAKLEDSLNTLPGVQRVTRRSYANGSATYELDIFTEAAPLLPRSIEENAAMKRYRLAVSSETRSKIVAALAP